MTIALDNLRQYVTCGVVNKNTPEKELQELRNIDKKYFEENGKHLYKFPV